MPVDPVTHLIAGGLAGAAGTTVTCPLEVVKTRLQSSVGQGVMRNLNTYKLVANGGVSLQPSPSAIWPPHAASTTTASFYIRHLLQTEGLMALFKGLAPSLIGIVPTRALYFTAYSQVKQYYNSVFKYESAPVHLCSAMTAGVVTTTCTSPLWVIKTQMQLEPGRRLSAQSCIRQIYSLDGLRGFYRGLSASYAGTCETAIHFVIYEHIKKLVRANREELNLLDCMAAAGVAKFTASIMCYPHEVCRTRLRQKVSRDQRRYHSFFQTLLKVWRDEGLRGLYGGMSAHLLRVVPNTAIVFCTYEAVVGAINRHQGGGYY